MTCKEATYLYEQKKEGKLTFGQKLSLGFHLLYCHLCRLFVKQSEQLEHSTRILANAPNTAPLSPSSKEKMQKALSREMNG